jgi:hypothetical protein
MPSLNQKIRALNGVTNWLESRDLPSDSRSIGRLTEEFLKHKRLPYKKEHNNPNILSRADIQNCIKIQDRFNEFTNYVLKKCEGKV